MKTVIKNILDTIIPEEYKNIVVYTDTGLRRPKDKGEIPYLHLITEPEFIDMIATYIWNYAPRSKTKYPKIMWPEGQLKYKKIEEVKEDMKALFGSTIMDNSTEEYLQEFYEKNILPNIK